MYSSLFSVRSAFILTMNIVMKISYMINYMLIYKMLLSLYIGMFLYSLPNNDQGYFMQKAHMIKPKPNASQTTGTKREAFKRPDKFTQQEVDLAKTPLFFPEGFEKIFLAIYFVILPYIAGLLFLFFYVAEAKIELFLSLNDESSFLLTWIIGYEIIAAIILLSIMKMAIGFANKNRKKGLKRGFKRP